MEQKKRKLTRREPGADSSAVLPRVTLSYDSRSAFECLYKAYTLVSETAVNALKIINAAFPDSSLEEKASLAVTLTLVRSIESRFRTKDKLLGEYSYFDNIYVIDGSSINHNRFETFVSVLYTPTVDTSDETTTTTPSSSAADPTGHVERHEQELLYNCFYTMFNLDTNKGFSSLVTSSSCGGGGGGDESEGCVQVVSETKPEAKYVHNLNFLVDFRAIELFCAYVGHFNRQDNSWTTNILDFSEQIAQFKATIEAKTATDLIFNTTDMPWLARTRQTAKTANLEDDRAASEDSVAGNAPRLGDVSLWLNGPRGSSCGNKETATADIDDFEDGPLARLSAAYRNSKQTPPKNTERDWTTKSSCSDFVVNLSLLLYSKSVDDILSMIEIANIARSTNRLPSALDTLYRERTLAEIVGPVNVAIVGDKYRARIPKTIDRIDTRTTTKFR